jgi:hypothetical protein
MEGPVAQRLEQGTHNPLVGGSNPSGPTKIDDPTRFVFRLAFQYPADDRTKWATFQMQQDAATRDAEAAAEQKRAQDQAKDK